jgi:hypothetical protein
MPASERVMRFEIARELLRPPDRPSLADVAALSAGEVHVRGCSA